jgi:TolA-binding protein
MEKSRLINGKSVNITGKKTSDWNDDELLLNNEDRALFESFGEYMRGELDIKDVVNDPELNNTRDLVNEMMSEYRKGAGENAENRDFIKSSLNESDDKSNTEKEIESITREMEQTNLTKTTAEWVSEWKKKKESRAIDPQYEERRNYISSSLDTEVNEPEEKIIKLNKTKAPRKLFARYATLSAAALLGAFIVIRSLLPSGDPGKVFSTYYEPIQAISPVSRNVETNDANLYTSAINSYKSGNYQDASLGFSKALETDPSSLSSKFFLGLTQIELGNYYEAADKLRTVADNNGEYGKEARWYLGLTCLMTGNIEKASECFEELAGSPGFYRDRSEKILRRLR